MLLLVHLRDPNVEKYYIDHIRQQKRSYFQRFVDVKVKLPAKLNEKSRIFGFQSRSLMRNIHGVGFKVPYLNLSHKSVLLEIRYQCRLMNIWFDEYIFNSNALS